MLAYFCHILISKNVISLPLPTTSLLAYHQLACLPPACLPTTSLLAYRQLACLPPACLPTASLLAYRQLACLPPACLPTASLLAYHQRLPTTSLLDLLVTSAMAKVVASSPISLVLGMQGCLGELKIISAEFISADLNFVQNTVKKIANSRNEVALIYL